MTACIVPLVVFAAVLLVRNASIQAEQTEGLVRDRARLLVEDVDREIARLIAAGEVLATDAALNDGDLAAFHDRASKVRDLLGSNVVVRDPTGQQIINTRVPWGAALPRNPAFDVDRRTIETRRPQVSGLIEGAVARAPLLIAVVPVFRDGDVRYLLSLTISLDRLQALFSPERLPSDWVAGIVDRDGVIIARSRNPARSVGTRLPPERWAAIQGAPEGIHRVRDLEGVPGLQAYSRSPVSGWLVGVSVAETVIAAPSRQTLLLFTAGGVILSLVSLGAAMLLGRRLSGPIRQLAHAAAALGAGEPMPPPARGIAEIESVGRTLHSAANLIQRREADLLDSETRYRAIVDTAVDALVVIDEAGTVQSFNPAAEQLFGYAAAEVVRQNVRMLMPEPHRAAHDGYLANYLSTGVRRIIGTGREVVGRRKDGSTFPVELAVAEWTAGGRRHFTGIMRDITERRNAEAALRASKAEADRANLAKSKFLAAASHDLRQPVQALVLFQSALADRLAGHPAAPMLEAMDKALSGLRMLLDSLLDVSRLDAGLVVARPADVSLQAMLERLCTEYRPQAQASGLRLRAVSTGAVVRSDPVLLERILRNLIENALRYTERGGILVGCRWRGGQVRVEVHDTGIGIAPDKHEEIFEEFFQIGNAERDRAKGLGLGLAVVRRLARLLGHDVAVRSVPGGGSIFSVGLPVVGRAAARDHRPARPANDDRAGVILVVDDEALVRMGLQAMLEGWGYRVLTAGSVEEAVRHVDGGAWPHAILADYRLRGGETGLDAIRAVHQRVSTPVPATVITGDTAPERLNEVRSGGYALLHKPVAAHELHTTVAEMMRAAE